ncbi:MAG TPA: sigma-70 family RNA polymerase sigma factor [Neobacillus sp.]|jgi:RNA polymerase sigma-B factor
MNEDQEEISPTRKESQYSLIAVYQETKSKQIATKLILRYSDLVGSTARKLSRNHPDMYDDLFQIGQLSLLRSLERYDQEYGLPFEAYAKKSIMGSMMNYLRDKAWIMPIPRWLKEQGVKVQRAIDELTVDQERSPSISEIACHTNLPMDLTKRVLAGQATLHVTSLDAPFFYEQEEFTLSDVIGASAMEYQAVETRLDVSKAFAELSEKEKQILHMNFMEGESQRTIANRLGISQMTVSRIQKQALKKLKQGLFQPFSSI